MIDGDFRRGSSWSEGVFEHAGRKHDSPRGTKLRKESFFEIAAVGMLALRYGWPVERLGFESPPRGPTPDEHLLYPEKLGPEFYGGPVGTIWENRDKQLS